MLTESMRKVLKYTDEELQKIINNCDTKKEFVSKIGLFEGGKYYKFVNELLEHRNLIWDKENPSRVYEDILKNCPECGSEFKTLKDHPREQTTCSVGCSNTHFRSGENRANYKNNKNKLACLNCNSDLGTSSRKFCNTSCFREFEYKDYINKWISGEIAGNERLNFKIPEMIRRYLFEKYESKCAQCSWGEINKFSKIDRPPLQIEHIDGDCSNNRPENLTLLCPNCHSLTPTFMALNKGNSKRPYKFMERTDMIQ